MHPPYIVCWHKLQGSCQALMWPVVRYQVEMSGCGQWRPMGCYQTDLWL